MPSLPRKGLLPAADVPNGAARSSSGLSTPACPLGTGSQPQKRGMPHREAQVNQALVLQSTGLPYPTRRPRTSLVADSPAHPRRAESRGQRP